MYFYLSIYQFKGNSILISENTNTLFYNSPIITEYNDSHYLSYLQNDGKIIVAKLDDDYNEIETTIVHDYGNRLFRKNLVKDGFADDHAAPAIIYDEALDTMWFATCYHGSALYIYKFDKINNKFQKYKVLNGFFTYPRFISFNDSILLFVREQVGSKRRTGNLVKFDSKSDFNNKDVIKKSIENKVYMLLDLLLQTMKFTLLMDIMTMRKNILMGGMCFHIT